jgi:hypothetical protein
MAKVIIFTANPIAVTMTTFQKFKGILCVFALLTATHTVHAQLQVTQLILKGHSATGFGAFFHGDFPVNKGNEITAEAGFEYFAPNQSHFVFIPLLVGFRHTFNGTGTGFYIEPLVGYTFGSTDIQKTDANGNPVFNADGSEIDEKYNGATAALGVGYILANPRCPLNFGLRYEHLFVSGTAPSLLTFRVSWSVLTARHLQQQQH